MTLSIWQRLRVKINLNAIYCHTRRTPESVSILRSYVLWAYVAKMLPVTREEKTTFPKGIWSIHWNSAVIISWIDLRYSLLFPNHINPWHVRRSICLRPEIFWQSHVSFSTLYWAISCVKCSDRMPTALIGFQNWHSCHSERFVSTPWHASAESKHRLTILLFIALKMPEFSGHIISLFNAREATDQVFGAFLPAKMKLPIRLGRGGC